MNLSEHERKKLDEFLLSIEPILAGYKHASFSYLAIRQDNDFILYQGSIEIDIPSGAVLHCFANYADEAHQHYWVRDPSTVQNPRRAVHQVFDDKMEILYELLKSQVKGRDARDFESAIAWILWMLGFNVTHLGGTASPSLSVCARHSISKRPS